MKILKSSLLAAAAFAVVLVVIAVFNSQSTTAQQVPPGREVKVINDSAEPVPVKLTPDATVKLPADTSINVSNFPAFPSFPSSIGLSRQKWEYMVFDPKRANSPYTLQVGLNELGEAGWEVVLQHRELGFVILKRPK